MAEEYDKSLNQLKEGLEKAKSMRIRAETRLEQLNKQKEDIVKEIRALGVEPENLESEIARLKTEIEDLLAKAKSMLPADLTR